MRKVTKIGSANNIGSAVAKKRGRPKKVTPSTVQIMKQNDDPDIKFIRDLTVIDRTEILEGSDPDYRYRWVEESKMAQRRAQGYSEVDEAGVKTHHDNNYWQPEGADVRRSNRGGLKLMKIPMSLAKKRDAIKAEKVERQSMEMDASLTNRMRSYGGEVMSDSATSDIVGGD